MPIKVSCACGHSFVARDEFGGKRVKCPACKEILAVPVAPKSAAASAPPGPTGKSPAGKNPAGGQLPPVDPRNASRTNPASSRSVGATRGGGISATQKVATIAPPKVPTKSAGAPIRPARPVPSSDRFNPLLDLLDEAGVKSQSTLPTCPNCQAEMSPTAIICIQCGFNRETGERLETFSDVRFDESTSTHVESDANTILAKAELELQANAAGGSPVEEDFGDGSDSIVVAVGAMLGFLILLVIGVFTVLIMDRLTGQVDPSQISFVVSLGIAVLSALYITFIAFTIHPGHGIACVLTGGLYCVIFGFMQGRAVILYTIILLVAIIVAIATGIYAANLNPTY